MAINDHKSQTPDDERDLAQTPQTIVQAIADFLGFTFLIDACASRATRKARYYYGLDGAAGGCPIGDDGLSADWAGDLRRLAYPLNGRACSVPNVPAVWMNPEFRGVGTWLAKARASALAGAPVVGCVKDAADTDWFRRMEYEATFLLVPDGRIQYIRPDGARFVRWNRRTNQYELSGPNFHSVFPVYLPFRAEGLAPRIRFTRPEKYLREVPVIFPATSPDGEPVDAQGRLIAPEAANELDA